MPFPFFPSLSLCVSIIGGSCFFTLYNELIKYVHLVEETNDNVLNEIINLDN